jgi:hypothetical protein
MNTSDLKAVASLAAGQALQGTATLKDGRTADLQVTVDAARPRVALIGKNIADGNSSSASNIQLANPDEVPQNSKLVFSIKAQSPAAFVREDKIEVATNDDSYSTVLSMGDGTLTLQDSSTALATFDPGKAFGGSAFGPLRFRIIDANGTRGDWQPLATLVRLPSFQTLKCPYATDQPCKLTGANLFLVDAVSDDVKFAHPVQVPDGFPGNVLPVPHPSSGELYVKLRDDPTVVNQVSLVAENVGPKPVPAAKPAPASNPPATAAPSHADQPPSSGKPRPDYVSPNQPPTTKPDTGNPAPDNPNPAAPPPSSTEPQLPATPNTQNPPPQNTQQSQE